MVAFSVAFSWVAVVDARVFSGEYIREWNYIFMKKVIYTDGMRTWKVKIFGD